MPKNCIFGIRTRFFLAFLLTSGALILVMFLVFRLTFDRGLSRYVQMTEKQRMIELAEHVEQAYTEQKGWDFLRGNSTALQEIIRDIKISKNNHRETNDTKESGRNSKDARERRPGDKEHFEERFILLDENQNLLQGPAGPWPQPPSFITLKAEGKPIGQLGLLPTRIIIDGLIRLFAEGQHQTLKVLSLGMAAGVAILSILLAHLLVRRITVLTGAVTQLASGRYDIQIPVQSHDELGQLAGDINSLARTLARNEQERHRWVADISHELRTPLAVLQAEIEAVQDGIHEVTPQTLVSLRTNVLHLGRLVDDLYQLARADIGALAYRKDRLDLGELSEQVVQSFQAQFSSHNISLHYTAEDRPFWVFGDLERLRQLLVNLLNNTLRYTDAGGEARVRLQRDSGKIVLSIDDSAPIVPAEALPHLFERLYRVETSRSRAHGGSGLGLAMCKAIVEAHNGTINARNSSLGGLEIEVILPERG